MGWLTRILGGNQPPRPSQTPPRRTEVAARPDGPPGARTPRLTWRAGSYPTNAVGESRRQEQLERICGRKARDGHKLPCEAVLWPEPTNPHDSNAIKVMIAGSHVGYLSRDDAIDFRERCDAAGVRGPVACDALIVGGWAEDGDEGSFGVRLAIPRRGALKFE